MSHIDGELGIGLDARCSLRFNLKTHTHIVLYLNVAYCLNIVTAYIHNMYYLNLFIICHTYLVSIQFNLHITSVVNKHFALSVSHSITLMVDLLFSLPLALLL